MGSSRAFAFKLNDHNLGDGLARQNPTGSARRSMLILLSTSTPHPRRDLGAQVLTKIMVQ